MELHRPQELARACVKAMAEDGAGKKGITGLEDIERRQKKPITPNSDAALTTIG